MSSCFAKTYASFVLTDSSLTLDKILTHLQQVIQSEVHNDGFDADKAYAPFSIAFDYDNAINPLLEDNFQLADYCKLTIESDSLFLEGNWVENTDDHLTRWVAWVMFREFGVGDVLSFSTETDWEDGSSSGCFYEVHRDGTVNERVVYSEVEQVC